MNLNGINYKSEEIPDAFAEHFMSKVANITAECKINYGVYNGVRLIHAGDENFMSELNVRKCLTGLKIKNCERVDRIPLRILNDGAEYLNGPITTLMKI